MIGILQVIKERKRYIMENIEEKIKDLQEEIDTAESRIQSVKAQIQEAKNKIKKLNKIKEQLADLYL